MSHKTAFIDANGIVVQAIAGDITEQQQALFLRDYGVLYGAVMAVPVDAETPVWIGGLYDPVLGVFAPPPQPDPLPEVIEGTATEIQPLEEIQP